MIKQSNQMNYIFAIVQTLQTSVRPARSCSSLSSSYAFSMQKLTANTIVTVQILVNTWGLDQTSTLPGWLVARHSLSCRARI